MKSWANEEPQEALSMWNRHRACICSVFCQKKPGLGLKTSGLVTWSDFASTVSLSHCGLRQESGRVIPTSQRYCEGQVMTREHRAWGQVKGPRREAWVCYSPLAWWSMCSLRPLQREWEPKGERERQLILHEVWMSPLGRRDISVGEVNDTRADPQPQMLTAKAWVGGSEISVCVKCSALGPAWNKGSVDGG